MESKNFIHCKTCNFIVDPTYITCVSIGTNSRIMVHIQYLNEGLVELTPHKDYSVEQVFSELISLLGIEKDRIEELKENN